MHQITVLTLLSVLGISLISLIGIIFFRINSATFKKFLIYLISFAAGALLGDVFLHLIPEISEENGFAVFSSFSILLGIIIFFVLEKLIHWRHCHREITEKNHVHSFAYMNLIGDAVHNFIDGSIIAAAYIASTPAGIATTIAIALHEIPQEIGEFAVLVRGGFSKNKALFFNFLSALFAILGALFVLIVGANIELMQKILIPIAAGGFIYIAGSDLIPELHKESKKLSHSLLQLLAFILGIAIMALLLFLE